MAKVWLSPGRLSAKKIRNSIDTLTECLPRLPARELAIGKLHREGAELSRHPPKSIGALLDRLRRAEH